MDLATKSEKWARWPDCKVELFLKIVVVSWAPKLRRDIDNFLSNSCTPLVHLEHKRVKKSAALLGVPDSDSKSLQIKYVRIVESFPKKPDLPVKLQEALKLCQDYPSVNFLLGRYFANPDYAPLFERFDQLIRTCTQMVVARRKTDLPTSNSSVTPEVEASTTDTPSQSENALKRVASDSKPHKIHKKRDKRGEPPPQGLRRSDRLAERLKDRSTVKVTPHISPKTGLPPNEKICVRYLPIPLSFGPVAFRQPSAPLSIPNAWRQIYRTLSTALPQNFRNPN